MKAPHFLLCLTLTATLAHADDKDGWQLLVTGSTTAGFRQLGGKATYSVADGVVTGTSVPGTPNSFLATEKVYGDFLLEYEFKVEAELNSGVQIRSNSLPEYKNGQVHGYQVEIDPDVKRGRLWSGGIYDEGRRGWLNDLTKNEPARKAFKADEWNKIRVSAIGDHIQTWINDVPAADLVDSMTQTGFIALQVHGIGTNAAHAGKQVQWRNLKIKDLGKQEWKPLFDGKSLAGWKPSPGGTWEIREGAIHGFSPASEKRHGLLLSDQSFKDFTVRFKFRVTAGDSGFYFRCQEDGSVVTVKGFQAEVDSSPETGGLYETNGRAWVVQTDPAAVSKIYHPGQWSEMSVSAHGGRIVVHVNGQKTAELLNDEPSLKEGKLALQLHGGMNMDVDFKDIQLLTPAR